VAVGYLRVSSVGQVDGSSLDHQRGMIAAWCRDNGLSLDGMFESPDGAESGRSLDRPGFQALLERVRRGDVGWVVVAAFDRFSRSTEDTCRILDEWSQAGVELIAISNGLTDLHGGNSRLLQHLLGWVAEGERQRIVGRVVPGLRARVRAGLPLGPLPVGYRLPPAAPGQRARGPLIEDPVTGPIVRAVFAKAAAGMGTVTLAQWARTNHPVAGRMWSVGMMAGLLRNRVYLGEISATVGGTTITLPGVHPPLVEQAVFQRVQQHAQQRSVEMHPGGSNHASAWSLLGGIATCARCGSDIVAIDDCPIKGPKHYRCRGDAPGASCRQRIGPIDGVDALVWREMELVLEANQSLLTQLVGQALDQLPRYLDERKQNAHALLQSLDDEEGRLIAQVEAGGLTAEAWGQAHDALELKRSRARHLLTETDGHAYLASLILATNPGGGLLQKIPFQHMMAGVTGMTHRRRVILALTTDIILPVESPIRLGDMPHIEVVPRPLGQPPAVLVAGFASSLAQHPGYDLLAGLAQVVDNSALLQVEVMPDQMSLAPNKRSP
jgi:site-specific DNA recombinase